MKPKQKSQVNSTSTDHIPVQFGAFRVSPHHVPYMSGSLTFREVAEWLSLVTDNAKYARQDWTIDELFQRDIDHARVRQIVSQYLNPTADRSQFFNSLTVVLMPDEEKKDKFIAPEWSDQECFENKFAVGPILVTAGEVEADAKVPSSKSPGSLSWNRDQVSAIAIDGQHRLAAIKRFHDLYKGDSPNSTINVIFIVISSRLGFKLSAQADPLKTMRSLFIDLNKHAVPVSRARNLLLDDQDPIARFVRSLFSSRLSFEGTGKIGSLGYETGSAGEFDNCLPLCMIDWHGDSKSKIDSGPYVASVLSLDWTVQKLLTAKSPRRRSVPSSINPDDEGAYTTFRAALQTWEVWKDPKLGLEKRLEEAESAQSGFYLTAEDTEALGKEFANQWGRPIVRLLVGLPGYDQVVDERIKHKTLDPKFAQWFQAKALVETNKNNAIKQVYDERLKQILLELKVHKVNLQDYEKCVAQINQIKEERIFFYLVGQRAAINALVDLCGMVKIAEWAKLLKWKLDDFRDCPQDFYANLLVTALKGIETTVEGSGLLRRDAKVAKGNRSKLKGLSQYFWAGSLVTRDPSAQVDYSNKAADRGAYVIQLLCFLYWFITCNRAKLSKQGVLDFVDGAIEGKLQKESFGFASEFSHAIQRFSGVTAESDVVPMRFLASSIETPTPEQLVLLAKERIFLAIDAIWGKN